MNKIKLAALLYVCIVCISVSCTAEEWAFSPRANARYKVTNWLRICLQNCNTLWCRQNCLEVSKTMCKEEGLEANCGVDGLYGNMNSKKETDKAGNTK
jgi:hypothetical protein